MSFFSFLCPRAPIITTHCSCCYYENDPPQCSQWVYPSYFPTYTFPTYTFPIPIAIPIFLEPQPPPPPPPPPTPPSSPSPPRSIPTMPQHTSLYTALNLTPPSDPLEIKRNYRLLALQFHPDKNPNPTTADTFKLISHANDILSSPKRKLIYDKHGEPATRNPAAYSAAGDPLPAPPTADFAPPYRPSGPAHPQDSHGYVPTFPDPRGDPFATTGAMPPAFARFAAHAAAAHDDAAMRRHVAELQARADALRRDGGRGGQERRASDSAQPRWGDGYGRYGQPEDYGAEYRGTSGGGGAYGSADPRMRGVGGGSYGGPRDGGEFARDGYGDGGFGGRKGGSSGGFGSAGGAGFGSGRK